MASLFGSMATEFGGTLKEMAQDKRDERLADEEHQRQLQLEKQRMQHESGLTDRRISADDARELRRQQYETAEREATQVFDTTTAETAHGREVEITGMQEQSDIIQTIISSTLKERNSRRMSGEGWNIDFEDRQGFDPMTGQMTYTEIVNATAPSGRPYRIMGDKAFPAGEQNPQVYPFQSIEQQRQAEEALYGGKVTVEQFRDDFGYIPSDYIFGKVTREEPQVREMIESVLGESPAWMNMAPSRTGGGSRRGRKGESPESRELRPKMEDDYVYPPGSEMKPSIEELSDGPARDAHLAARGGKTNADLAAEMRAKAQGGTLAEAERLEQGGQLEQPDQPNQPAESPYGFELDDAGAAEVATSIGAAMSGVVDKGMNYSLGGTN